MKVLKFLGYAAGTLAAAIALGATGIYFASNAKLSRHFAVNARPVVIPSSPEAIARGEHLARTRGCVDCHGANLAGAKVMDDGAMGRIHGTNLTRGRGSRTAVFTDSDWVRAIRHGVAPDGRALFLMPSEEYSHFSDEDLGSLIAYLKTVPAVDQANVPLAFGPVTRALLAFGKMKLAATTIDHARIHPATVAKAVTVDYGRYLANGCTGCHGANFSGGKIEIGPPDWPPARNLTPHPTGDLARWTEADFVRALREARRPDGAEISPVMPRAFAGLDDIELRALFAYFRSLPPAATGTR
ncbi:c-type cytochrome [Opitutus sp. ER46]|uniref:c-type cytochrome n=1 Tax=Opitutus sp. ER46 TaxID=2161864 RepID=UPI000D305D47|nr:c-type cytochrome [Opitutus sp. ER46]PTX90644.1 cytochrome C [Opitutus sp. ER46]